MEVLYLVCIDSLLNDVAVNICITWFCLLGKQSCPGSIYSVTAIYICTHVKNSTNAHKFVSVL